MDYDEAYEYYLSCLFWLETLGDPIRSASPTEEEKRVLLLAETDFDKGIERTFADFIEEYKMIIITVKLGARLPN